MIVDKANITINDIDNAVGEYGDPLLLALYADNQYDKLDIIADKINKLCVSTVSNDLDKMYDDGMMCSDSYKYIKARCLL